MTINVRDSDDLGKFILLLAQVDKESVMYDVIKIQLNPTLFWGVSFPTFTLIHLF